MIKELPLYDESLEKQYLSLIYLDTDINKKIEQLAKIDESAFYLDKHKRIFKAYRKLLIDKKATTLELDMLRKETGIKATELLHLCCVPSQYTNKSVIKQLIEIRNLRELRKIRPILDNVSIKADSQKLIQLVMKQLEKVLIGKDERPTISDVIRQGRKLDKVKRMKSGLATLDKITQGLAPTQIWILGGGTGQGKSLMAMQFAIKQLFDGYKVAFFSTELANWTNLKRMRRMIVGLEMIDDKEAEEWLKGLDDVFFLMDDKYSVEEIETTVRALNLKFGIDLLIVDHIHNLIPEQGEIYEGLVVTTSRFQALAKELEIGVFLISQLSIEATKNISSPIMGFRGANKIGEIADLAIIMHRARQADGTMDTETHFILKKHRHGAIGDIKTYLDIDSLTFQEKTYSKAPEDVIKGFTNL